MKKGSWALWSMLVLVGVIQPARWSLEQRYAEADVCIQLDTLQWSRTDPNACNSDPYCKNDLRCVEKYDQLAMRIWLRTWYPKNENVKDKLLRGYCTKYFSGSPIKIPIKSDSTPPAGITKYCYKRDYESIPMCPDKPDQPALLEHIELNTVRNRKNDEDLTKKITNYSKGKCKNKQIERIVKNRPYGEIEEINDFMDSDWAECYCALRPYLKTNKLRWGDTRQ